MSEWGGPCTACGHPASYHGATFCQVRAGAAQKRDCDCTGYASPHVHDATCVLNCPVKQAAREATS